MKTTVDYYDFIDAFRRYGRLDTYSSEGIKMLYGYLDGLKSETGDEIELDVVGFCCEYDETPWNDIAANYSIEFDDDYSEDDKIDAVREYLSHTTLVVGETTPGVFLYVAF